jgi:lipopolysaccharide transport system ATP-binding protein
MDDTVIKVENISKRYRLGTGAPYKTLRESIVNLVRKTLPIGRRHEMEQSVDAKRGELWALHDVSFEVKYGDIIGVIGRNGAGKSTLLKILARITEPTAGRITMKGRVGSLLEVGTGFHPELSGHENIYLYGAILGMDRYEVTRKFDEIIAFAELEKFVETPVKHYSSGMYMRLAFAVAAHLDPEILLVDEVLAVGDASFQQKCLGKMGEVSRGGRTVLFVSHNMSSIQRLCTKALLLDKGQIIATGSAAQVTEQYLREGAGTSLGWVREEKTVAGAYFTKVFLWGSDGKEADHVTMTDSLRVVFEFSIRNKFRDLKLAVDLLDRAGETIFASSPLDAEAVVPDDPGSYRASIELPGEILLAKSYGIRTTLWNPASGILDRVDTIKFVVQETDSFASRIPQGRPGLLAIRCKWTIEAR